MTNPDYTAIAFLVDRSGSMERTKDDAIGGMKTFIEEQQKLPGKCTLRVSQFDTAYDVVYESTPIADVPEPDLQPRGGTALLDSWGKLINDFGEELAALPEDERPENVIFVTITDGEENSSREWTRDQLFKKITEQTEKYGWKFLYLGADQDAVQVGTMYGVGAGNSMAYANTPQGNQQAYAAVTQTVTSTRSGNKDAQLTDED